MLLMPFMPGQPHPAKRVDKVEQQIRMGGGERAIRQQPGVENRGFHPFRAGHHGILNVPGDDGRHVHERARPGVQDRPFLAVGSEKVLRHQLSRFVRRYADGPVRAVARKKPAAPGDDQVPLARKRPADRQGSLLVSGIGDIENRIMSHDIRPFRGSKLDFGAPDEAADMGNDGVLFIF